MGKVGKTMVIRKTGHFCRIIQSFVDTFQIESNLNQRIADDFSGYLQSLYNIKLLIYFITIDLHCCVAKR